MKRYILCAWAALYILAVGCDDFLAKEPTKSSAQKVETLDDLDAILNEPMGRYNNSLHMQQGGYADFYCTDNAEIPLETFKTYESNFSMDELLHYLWQTTTDFTMDTYWNSCYSAVWTANLIINSVGGMAGDEVQKNNLKAEAHALRAYKYFALAQTYCLHYTEATAGEPGLPLRTGTDFEESLERATLAETYALIESDLKEALKISVPFAGKRWRASRASVNALAARYYLYRGNYTEAEKYANLALKEFGELIDYTTIGTYLYNTYNVSLGNGGERQQEVYYPNTFRNTEAQDLNWAEQYQTEVETNSAWRILPSMELLELYRQYPHDLRYDLFMVEGYMNRTKPSEHSWYGYVFLANGTIYSGPSVAEMYLVRAECKARNNDIPGCMTDVETVRAKRFAAENYQKLPEPADRKAAVQVVLDERRREAPFALRWMDLRRLTSDDLMEPVTVKRKFWPLGDNKVNAEAELQEYVLSPDSRTYARPLGKDVINLSGGQTVQNRY